MARIVVLGASGFLGSHLCDELIARGDAVVGIDDLSSSTGVNLKALESEPRFTFLKGDIAEGIPMNSRKQEDQADEYFFCFKLIAFN